MTPAVPERNAAAWLARILRDAERRLDYEPAATAATLFNGLRNIGWSEEEILSTLRFERPPALRLRHPAADPQDAFSGAIRHAGAITRVRFAPGGDAVFSCSEIGEIIRWQSPGGAAAFARHGHTGAITHCITLPQSATAGQPRLLTTGADGCGRMWHSESGELLAEMAGHTGPIQSLAVSGEQAVTGSADATLRLWNLEHCTTMAVLMGHAAPVTACAFAEAGSGPATGVYSGSADGSVLLWDVTGRLVRRFDGHTARVTSLTLEPGFGALISTADDCTVRIWDLESGHVRYVLTGHILGVSGCLVEDTPAPTIVSWSLDRTIRRWNLHDGEPAAEPLRHDGAVEGCAAIDGRLLSWSADGTLRLWDSGSGAEIMRAAEQSRFRAADVMGQRVAAATAGGAIRIWSSGDLVLEQTLCSGDVAVAMVRPPRDYSPGGFWTASNVVIVGAQVTELDVSSGDHNPLDSSGLERLTGLLGGTVSANGRRMLLWSRDHVVCVETEKRPAAARWAAEATVDGAVLTSDAFRAVSWADRSLTVWDVETGAIERTIAAHVDRVSTCVLIGDSHACSASFDGTLRAWDLRTGTESGRASGHAGRVLGCVAVPGDLLLSWSDDRTVRLWNYSRAADGTMLFTEFERFEVPGAIETVALGHAAYTRPPHPAARLVIGTADGRVISDPLGLRPREVRLHTHRIRDIVFLPDLDTVACCSDDGTVRLWRDGEAVTGAVFYTSVPVVRLLRVERSLVALDEHGRPFVLQVGEPAGPPGSGVFESVAV